jgi:hypothetical protein
MCPAMGVDVIVCRKTASTVAPRESPQLYHLASHGGRARRRQRPSQQTVQADLLLPAMKRALERAAHCVGFEPATSTVAARTWGGVGATARLSLFISVPSLLLRAPRLLPSRFREDAIGVDRGMAAGGRRRAVQMHAPGRSIENPPFLDAMAPERSVPRKHGDRPASVCRRSESAHEVPLRPATDPCSFTVCPPGARRASPDDGEMHRCDGRWGWMPGRRRGSTRD